MGHLTRRQVSLDWNGLRCGRQARQRRGRDPGGRPLHAAGTAGSPDGCRRPLSLPSPFAGGNQCHGRCGGVGSGTGKPSSFDQEHEPRFSSDAGPHAPVEVRQRRRPPGSGCLRRHRRLAEDQVLYNHRHPNVLDTGIPYRSNAEGIFEWTWAPSDEVRYDFFKEGMPVGLPDQGVIPEEETQIIRMVRQPGPIRRGKPQPAM